MKHKLWLLSAALLALAACKKDSNSNFNTENVSPRAASAIPALYEKNASSITVYTFNGQFLNAGNNPSGSYIFPADINTASIKKIWMYIKLRKHSANAIGEYDVFSRINITVPDPTDQTKTQSLELGRFITPFGKDNSTLPDGFVVDVTDFKSVLKNTVNLTSFAESYSGGWALNVSFKFELGTPDFKYYAIAPVMNYNNSAQVLLYGEGVVGKNRADYKDNYTIKVPVNAQQTALRTIITGWGSASPFVVQYDPVFKQNAYSGYAEFAYTTHHIDINNGEQNFTEYMGPLGCGGENKNQVQNQSGTWIYQRAGWCPGMVVPVRSDILNQNHAGQDVNYKFNFQNDWTNDQAHGKAYFSLSSYVVVKSNTPIQFASDYLQAK